MAPLDGQRQSLPGRRRPAASSSAGGPRRDRVPIWPPVHGLAVLTRQGPLRDAPTSPASTSRKSPAPSSTRPWHEPAPAVDRPGTGRSPQGHPPPARIAQSAPMPGCRPRPPHLRTTADSAPSAGVSSRPRRRTATAQQLGRAARVRLAPAAAGYSRLGALSCAPGRLLTNVTEYGTSNGCELAVLASMSTEVGVR